MFLADSIDAYVSDYRSVSFALESFAKFRDIFNACLDAFISCTNQYLVAAIIGEIGNNTFDHNYVYQSGKPKGVYFLHDEKVNVAVLADYGSGIRTTLSRIKHGIASDKDALQIAFTQMISGRAPEQRGNGLKFVCKTICERSWNLYFHLGAAFAAIQNGKITFCESNCTVSGCLAIVHWEACI